MAIITPGCKNDSARNYFCVFTEICCFLYRHRSSLNIENKRVVLLESVVHTVDNYQTHNKFIMIMKEPSLIFYSAS